MEKEKHMKKISAVLSLFVFLTAAGVIFAAGQKAELMGTWKGVTHIPEEDEVTLVIKEDQGELVVAMSDSLVMLSEIECEDVEFEDGTLTFNFVLTQGLESQTIWITLDLEGETLKGYWEDEGGEQGDIELTKQ
jgi:hypothetical protein